VVATNMHLPVPRTLSVLFTRYDIIPVLAGVLAVEGARRRQWGRAWVWATLGGS